VTRDPDKAADAGQGPVWARGAAWTGILAIVVLSVVPAEERPVTSLGSGFEHLAAFGLVGALFALGYRFSLIKLCGLATLFCAGIELLQIPLPTRHARLSDFLADLLSAWLGIFCVLVIRQIRRYKSSSRADCD
jgi:VanZ like family